VMFSPAYVVPGKGGLVGDNLLGRFWLAAFRGIGLSLKRTQVVGQALEPGIMEWKRLEIGPPAFLGPGPGPARSESEFSEGGKHFGKAPPGVYRAHKMGL